jgi:hypothetical protein
LRAATPSTTSRPRSRFLSFTIILLRVSPNLFLILVRVYSILGF